MLDRQKIWGKHDALLLDQEKEIISFLDKELNKEDSLIKIIFSSEKETKPSKTNPDKMTWVFTKLRELLNKQTAALDKLEEEILKPKKAGKTAVRHRRKSL